MHLHKDARGIDELQYMHTCVDALLWAAAGAGVQVGLHSY